MTLRATFAALIGAALLASMAPASAESLCKAPPAGQKISADVVKAKAESLGYEVRKVGEEDGCWEVKGMKDGKRVEAYFDPANGKLVKTKGES